MYSLLITISLLISLFLIIVVLLQSSKGGGLAGTFGGGGGGQFGTVFGTRRTADFLSRSTWWLAGALLVLTIIINLFFLPGRSSTEARESIIQSSGRQAVPQSPVLPQQSPVQQQQSTQPPASN